jgi:hypothetical protein
MAAYTFGNLWDRAQRDPHPEIRMGAALPWGAFRPQSMA